MCAMSPRLLRPRASGFRYASLRQGLVAYWPLNETAASGDVTAKDESGNGYDLTSNNSVLSTPGKIGNARQFVAANTEFLSIASSAGVQFGEDAWTFSLWLYVPASASGVMQVFSKDENLANGREIETNYNQTADSIRLFVYTTDDFAAAPAIVAAPRDQWNFVAATHAAGSDTVTLRVNTSTSTTVRQANKTYQKSVTQLRVGARVYAGFVQPLTGSVDEVAKWNRALSAAELDQLYNSGNGINLGQR